MMLDLPAYVRREKHWVFLTNEVFVDSNATRHTLDVRNIVGLGFLKELLRMRFLLYEY